MSIRLNAKNLSIDRSTKKKNDLYDYEQLQSLCEYYSDEGYK